MGKQLRVLFSAINAEPRPVGGNRLVAAQAQALKELGVDVEIVTAVPDGYWSGPAPDDASPRIGGVPYIQTEREGVPYYVFRFPPTWTIRVPTEQDRDEAVAWGVDLLRRLSPDVLHQHYWQQTRWMLEAAHRRGIPSIYTFYDFGVGCLRTTLVTGTGQLCDGRVETTRCGACIRSGYSVLGKINDSLVQLEPIASLVRRYGFGPNLDGPLASRGGVSIPATRRTRLTIQRARSEFSSVGRVIVPSPYAGQHLAQFGVPPERVKVMPWPIDHEVVRCEMPPFTEGLRVGYLGRISPEKGIDVLLRAAERVSADHPIFVHLAGAVSSNFAKRLQQRYAERAGPHQVKWWGVINRTELVDFFKQTHVGVVPSVWMDNTPTSMLETIAYGRPVIVSALPTLTHLFRDGVSGFAFPMGDVDALAAVLESLAQTPARVMAASQQQPQMLTSRHYANGLISSYMELLDQAQRSR